MAYVRISLMRPKRGQEQRLTDLIDQLAAYYRQQPGFLNGYRLSALPGDTSGRLGRVGVWESAAAAERAAGTDHDLAMRSEVNMAVEDGSHEELAFEGVLV